jgi:hypothetical protein
MAKRKKCSLSLKKENEWMKRVIQLLKSSTLIFDQTHQLISCWTVVYKAFIAFRIFVKSSTVICKRSVKLGI